MIVGLSRERHSPPGMVRSTVDHAGAVSRVSRPSRSQGETMIQRIIFTAVFGFLRWNIFNYVGAGPSYLMILGSVLAVCACC